MFDLGADLATPFGTGFEEHALRMVARQVERLEEEIDAMNASLDPLTSFILPGVDGGRTAPPGALYRAQGRTGRRGAARDSAGQRRRAGLFEPIVGSSVCRGKAPRRRTGG